MKPPIRFHGEKMHEGEAQSMKKILTAITSSILLVGFASIMLVVHVCSYLFDLILNYLGDCMDIA